MVSDLSIVYNLVGQDEFFKKLVDLFYSKIDTDPILRHLFPKSLEKGKRWSYLFFRQIFGGPSDYTKERGHPRMRKRHFPFKIGLNERNQWFKLLMESLDELEVIKGHPAREIMENYFSRMATHMINQKIEINDLQSSQLNINVEKSPDKHK